MPQIEPFQGLRFDPLKVGDLANILCPPYDVISPAQQQQLLDSSPYNIVRVELGPDLPGDSGERNRYTRAAEALWAWQAEGALARDPRPAYYLVAHTFQHRGAAFTRRGVLAALRLQPWSAGRVRPHEETFSGPKEDRYRLLSCTRVNVSPVFTVYRHQPAALQAAWNQCERRAADVEIVAGRESQRLWVVDDPQMVRSIAAGLADEVQYIADGHHRYETALRYRDELAASGALTPDHPASCVLTYLVHAEDAGLVVMPTHRLVRDVAPARLHEVLESLVAGLELRRVPLGGQPSDEELVESLGDTDATVSFGMVTAGEEGMLVLSVRDPGVMERAAPDKPPAWRSLDVAALQTLLLDPLLPTHHERDASITYSRDGSDAVAAVKRGDYQVAFIMGPPTVDEMAAVADADTRMPEKSTYFYPKVPTGLVLRRLD